MKNEESAIVWYSSFFIPHFSFQKPLFFQDIEQDIREMLVVLLRITEISKDLRKCLFMVNTDELLIDG